jgi:hypothetical protein
MRENRILKPGATRHVTARANRKELILHCDAMQALFSATIKRTKKKFCFQIRIYPASNPSLHILMIILQPI